MARAFVLIDALPGMEAEVEKGLTKVEAVKAHRVLITKVANADLLALVEAADEDAIDKVLTGQVRGITGVYTVQRLKPEHTVLGNLPKLMREMDEETAKTFTG